MKRIKKIREAEAQSHIQMYRENELFTGSTWLSKPVRTVIELLPLLNSKENIAVLDLGCGVGRNCIPVAQRFAGKNCKIDCVDILPEAIFILAENAKRYQVESAIKGIVCSIDDYIIQPGHYDLIIAVSALEHMDSRDSLADKLCDIRDGLKPGGIVCIITNADISENDKHTGDPLEVQFEINLGAQELLRLFHYDFSSFSVMKETVRGQSYELPRESGTTILKCNVVTFAAQK